jgi:hypothetical protein
MELETLTDENKPATRLHLNSLDHARNSLARIIRSFYDGRLEEGKYRALVYGMTAYLGFLRLGEEIKASCKLDELISLLKAKGIE